MTMRILAASIKLTDDFRIMHLINSGTDVMHFNFIEALNECLNGRINAIDFH
jgi:hypothetical protein